MVVAAEQKLGVRRAKVAVAAVQLSRVGRAEQNWAKVVVAAKR